MSSVPLGSSQLEELPHVLTALLGPSLLPAQQAALLVHLAALPVLITLPAQLVTLALA